MEYIVKAPRDKAVFYRLALTKEMYDFLSANRNVKTFYGKELTKWIGKSLETSKAKLFRGDVVELSTENPDEMAFYYIFDGKNLIVFSPNPDPDSDSTVPPPSFQVVTEFPIHYWDSNPKYRGSGNEVYLDLKPFAKELIMNMQMNLDAKGKWTYMTWFDYKKISYVVIVEEPVVPFEKFQTVINRVAEAIKTDQYTLSPQPDGNYNQMSMTENVLFMHLQV